MPWEPAAPPLLSDENANELGRWALQQLQQLAAALENPDITAYRVLHVEPEKPREGQIVVADGSDWDPGDGPGQYMFIGGQWVIQRAGPEPNTYGIITDGTTPAPAEVAGDTFKVRGANGVKVTTQNDDATHGDNALFEMDINGLTSTTPALDDKVPFGDTSASNAPKRMTPQTLLDLVNSLATEATPDLTADWLLLGDASGGVAAKVQASKIGGETLISTTDITGAQVDITIPSGYKTFELRLFGWQKAATTIVDIRLSEDGGSTFLTAAYQVFNDAAVVSATTGDSSPAIIPNGGAAAVYSHIFRVRDYGGSRNKFMTMDCVLDSSGSAFMGNYIFDSTAAVDFVRLIPQSGNFSGSGVAELWGIP